MNDTKLLVRLIGELPPSEYISKLLGEKPNAERRRGMPSRIRGLVLENDVWTVTLIERDEWTEPAPEQAALDQAIDRLRRMAPALASLDRRGFKTELYVSTLQDEDQGRFEIPAAIIALAGQARLDLVVSILNIGASDDDEDDSTEDGPDDPARGSAASASREEL